jgi:plastocyanin
MRGTLSSRHRKAVTIAAIAGTILAASLAGAFASAAGRGDHRSDRRTRVARVDISEFAFHPRKIRVRRGTKVVFSNGDSTAHTATRRGGFGTGRIPPGRSAVVKLRRAGVYAYHCTIHPFMRGKVVVR